MKDKTGKKFESLVEHVAKMFADKDTTVQKDQSIPSEHGERQFDVIVTRKIPPFGEFKIGIEARDHQSKGDITQIDGFVSKLADCAKHIDKGIMVNRRGFSKNAMRKATRNGIKLYRLEDHAEELVKDAFALPIIITEHRVAMVGVGGSYEVKSGFLVDKKELVFNGKSYSKVCLDAIKEHPKPFNETTVLNVPITSLSISGNIVEPIDMSFEIHIITRHHFGFLNQLPETIVLKGQTGEDDRALIDLKSLLDNHRSWPIYWDIDDAPDHVGVVTGASIAQKLQHSFIDDFVANPSMSSEDYERASEIQYRLVRKQ